MAKLESDKKTKKFLSIVPRKNPFITMSKEKRAANARKANSVRNPDGYIYIFKLVGFDIYKIGSSSNVRRRLLDVRSAQAFDVLERREAA